MIESFVPASNCLNPQVLYHDASLLVVDKPAGLLSVPGRGLDKLDCAVARVHRQFPTALTVHRLDLATSGILVFALSPAIHRELSAAFAKRDVEKRYVALVHGSPLAESGSIDLPLIADWPNRPRQKVDIELGKPSCTLWQVAERLDDRSTRLNLTPVTGRSHQLRVHLAAIGHPILGDRLYGNDETAERMMLHATEIELPHPHTGERLRIRSPAPF